MDENSLEICRTCLKKRKNKMLPLLKLAHNANPEKTYGQILEEYGRFEFITEQEAKMPQGLCVLCCRQLRNICKFIQNAQECNEKLLSISLNQHSNYSDCLREEAIDLPSEVDVKTEICPSEESSNDDLLNEQTLDESGRNDSMEENKLVDFKDAINDATLEIEDNYSAPRSFPSSNNEANEAESTSPCPICSKLLKRAYLLKHLRKMHSINKPSSFLKKQEWSSNLKKTEGNLTKIYKCEQCDYIAKSKAGINYHKRTKHTTKEDLYTCKFCTFATLKKLDLVNHIKDRHKVDFKALKKNARKKLKSDASAGFESAGSGEESSSEIVPAADSSDDDEFIHDMINVDRKIMKANYVDGEPFNSLARKCQECGKVYKDFASLYAHQRFVHMSEDMYSVCAFCGKKYKRNKDLKNHVSQVHSNEIPTATTLVQTVEMQEKRYICNECPYKTTTNTHLQLHIRRHHTLEKPFICEICGNSFLTSYDLKKHRYLHTGEKPYKCPMCPKTFRVSSKLTKHKRVHTGERPFKCAECGKGFTQEYNLSVHKRTHMRIKQQKSNIPQW